MLLDIDDFTRLNGTHRHGAGDLCLQSFVKLAKSTLRKEDLFARTGGEEFAVVLADTAQNEALAIAERLRSAVAAMESSYEGVSFRVSVSISRHSDRPPLFCL